MSCKYSTQEWSEMMANKQLLRFASVLCRSRHVARAYTVDARMTRVQEYVISMKRPRNSITVRGQIFLTHAETILFSPEFHQTNSVNQFCSSNKFCSEWSWTTFGQMTSCQKTARHTTLHQRFAVTVCTSLLPKCNPLGLL